MDQPKEDTSGRKKKKPVSPHKGQTKKELTLLWDMLCRETDEEHPMSCAAICAWMEASGLPHSRDMLAEDLKLLEELKGSRFGVAHTSTSEKLIYVDMDQRLFDMPELKLLTDVLQASGAISEDRTHALTDKLLTLASEPQARQMRQETSLFNLRKHCNRSVIYNIANLSEARHRNRLVTFRYYYLDENRCPVYQREPVAEKGRAPYIVAPLELIYREDNYYLIAWDCDRQRLAHFRLDRMQDVKITGLSALAENHAPEDTLADYAKQVFGMFSGEKSEITLRLHDLKAIGIVYDHFGEETQIRRLGPSLWETTVAVRPSPQLWGWLCGLREMVTLTGPKDAKEAYCKWLAQALMAEAE